MRKSLAFLAALAALFVFCLFAYAAVAKDVDCSQIKDPDARYECQCNKIENPRARFFCLAKQATLYGDGRKFISQDCCGVGDATKIRVLRTTRSPRGLTYHVQVIDPMRHPTVKTGDEFTVLQERYAIKPVAPMSLGNILFVDGTGRWTYCMMLNGGG